MIFWGCDELLQQSTKQMKDLMKNNIRNGFVNEDGTAVKHKPLFFSGKDRISRLKAKYK